MKTQEAFPRTTAHLTQATPESAEAFGDADLEWTRDSSTERLRAALISLQQMCDGDFDRLSDLTVKILQDILALRRTAYPEAETILNFLQIDISISVMGTALVQKRLQTIYDWAIYSISDTYPFELEIHFEIPRLRDLFIRSHPTLYARLGREIGLEWIKIFYYYVFKVGGLKELARLIAPFVGNLLIRLLPQSDAIEPAVRFAEWGARDSYVDRRQLVLKLQQVLLSSKPGSDTHFFLGLAFALLIGTDCGMDTRTLARSLLQTYAHRLPPNSELQLLQAALIPDSEEIKQNLERIVETVRRYRQHTLSAALDDVLIEYEFQRSFTLVNAIVLTLLTIGESNAAALVIGAWKGVYGDSTRQDVLFVLPDAASGVLYSLQGDIYKTDAVNGRDTYSPLIDAINHFHGINIVMDDDDSLTPHTPIRPGIPDDPIQSSANYSAAMREQFHLPEAKEFLANAKQGPTNAMQLVPGLPIPLQPVMIKEIGFSWPIASTMSSPHSDRLFRRALIWTGSTFLGAQQAEWIAEVLRPQIDVTIASGDENKFSGAFSSPEYDVVWVTTHGEYDHMDPHRSTLVINDGIEMTFDDLRKIAIHAQDRRLLVLDACDSGAEPIYGGISSLGFGPLLASASQAIICYRWPVEQFASAVFNVLLAVGLRTRSFYGAYEFAVITILQGKQTTIQQLTGFLGQDHNLVKRVRENGSIRWNTLAFWGSAAFLE